MKKKFKLLNDSFTHIRNGNKGYMIHGKESKCIEWVHMGEGKQQETFNSITSEDETWYVDRFLPAGFNDTKSSGKAMTASKIKKQPPGEPKPPPAPPKLKKKNDV